MKTSIKLKFEELDQVRKEQNSVKMKLHDVKADEK